MRGGEGRWWDASFGNHFFVLKETRAEDGGGDMGVTDGLLKVSLGRRVLLELDWRGLKVQKKHMWKLLDGH